MRFVTGAVIQNDPELGTELAQLEVEGRGRVRELPGKMVGRDGIEPPTPGFSGLGNVRDHRPLSDTIGKNFRPLPVSPPF
jgi:hypothetical protein